MSSPKRRPLNIAAIGAAAIPQPDPVHEANRTKEPTRPKAVSLVEEDSVVAPTYKKPPSREGLVQIQGYYPEETRRRLKMLAAKMGQSQEKLLGVALEYLFEKYDH